MFLFFTDSLGEHARQLLIQSNVNPQFLAQIWLVAFIKCFEFLVTY